MTKNKNIIILGSEGALGSEVISLLQQKKNLNLILSDKNEKTSHQNVNYFRADFTKPNEVEKLSQFLQKNLAAENTLISTVGRFGDDYSTQKISAEKFLESLQINLLSLAKICVDLSQKCAAEEKKMRFVITGSAASKLGSRDIAYGISKAGLNGLVISLSKSFAAKSITVIGVNPGIFSSPMSQGVAKERQKFEIEQTHIKRAGTAAEIASSLVYAALEAPDFMTGSLIDVSGGR